MAKNNVTADITGVKALMNNLEKKLSEKEIAKISKKVVKDNAHIVADNLKKDMEVYKDTGASIDEVVVSSVTYKNSEATAKIGWNGPKDRYRIIHLNEWGYTKNGKQITPNGFGVVEKSYRGSEDEYASAVEKDLRGYL